MKTFLDLLTETPVSASAGSRLGAERRRCSCVRRGEAGRSSRQGTNLGNSSSAPKHGYGGEATHSLRNRVSALQTAPRQQRDAGGKHSAAHPHRARQTGPRQPRARNGLRTPHSLPAQRAPFAQSANSSGALLRSHPAALPLASGK